jgi:hypothetical protein
VINHELKNLIMSYIQMHRKGKMTKADATELSQS